MHPVLTQIGPLIIPSYGAVASVGVLLSLWLAQWTSRRTKIDPRHTWNMLVLAVFASLVTSRLLLIAINLGELRSHPAWLLAVAMVHHPLLSAAGVLGGAIAVLIYARWARISLPAVADTLASPVSIGMAAEQLGALMAGSDYGRFSPGQPLMGAVIYSSSLAARWSGTPLGLPLYPVQGYAAGGALLVAALTCAWFFWPRRTGDVASIWLIATGAMLFLTELFRDWEGRGVLARGILDIPQLVALAMVLLGGALLCDWRRDLPHPVHARG